MRKHHVRASVAQAVAVVRMRGVASVEAVAAGLDISSASARRKLDAAVALGVLVCDDHDAAGHPLPHERWRYTEAA